MYTRDEAAAYLGLSPGTLRNWAASRRIPTVKIGGAVRYDVRDLDRIIAAGRRASAVEKAEAVLSREPVGSPGHPR